ALNQIGSILQMSSPVPRFPKVDRATAAALGNNFQPYMQARRQDIQAQQQDRRTAKENALREKAMFMQQQRQEQERRDRLAYQQMLMENNEREEQLALKRFEFEAARAAREEQRYKEEQARPPQRRVDESTGVSYWQDPVTGEIKTQVVPEMQAALAQRAARSGGGGGGSGSAGGMNSAEIGLLIKYGLPFETVRALTSGAPLTPDDQANLESAHWNMMENERVLRHSSTVNRLRSDLGYEAAKAAADELFPPTPKPKSMLDREERDRIASMSEEELKSVAWERTTTTAPPDEVVKYVNAGLVSREEASAALALRGMVLPPAEKQPVSEPKKLIRTTITGNPI
ncbi:MAG TPA: hypothetical protein PLI98_10385, partial [Candidatus Hydrogenedentes bacterium]|nr:hypothetical protein [Candidatus Hydrogenedentota bacterium]